MRKHNWGTMEQVGWDSPGSDGVVNIIYDSHDKSFILQAYDYLGHGVSYSVTKQFLHEMFRDGQEWIASRGTDGAL